MNRSNFRANSEVICVALALVALPALVPPSIYADEDEEQPAVNLSAYELGVIGAVEAITVGQSDNQVLARVDTGATTTSMHAVAIKRFERDRKPWVRFVVPNAHQAGEGKDAAGDQAKDQQKGDSDSPAGAEYELPLIQEVTIKRHDTEGQVRPVVQMTLKFGKIDWTGEVSLTDRSAYVYPVLLGRNTLAGNALVDCGRGGLLGPLPEKSEED